ncbi:MAG: cell division protein ZapE [Acinetobacter sp.]
MEKINCDNLNSLYHTMIQNGEVLPDPTQQHAIEYLNGIREKLNSKSHFFAASRIQGLYIWGSVGTGKTWMMDLFYKSVTSDQKMRVHFHHFLKNVHQQLVTLRGNQDPLKIIANDIARKYKLICFDEFFVSNVADAMILSSLFNFLFAKNIVLVATSNIDPSDLYKDGLNRDRFLETIQHIYNHCQVLEIGNQVDYRTIKKAQAERCYYHSPLNDAADIWINTIYAQLTNHHTPTEDKINVNGRPLLVKATFDNVVWFDFEAICREARSPADYIDIAQQYEYVLISGIDQLTDKIYDAVRRFIYLIDELYDQKICLYFTSSQPLDQLYQGQRLGFEFKRTYSRLQEMQSISYHQRHEATD